MTKKKAKNRKRAAAVAGAAPCYANPVLASARAKFQAAADQLKRGEWNSYNSGTWTLINDGLTLLDSHNDPKLSLGHGENPETQERRKP